MQSKSFDEILLRLEDSNYEVRNGKSVAVKPKYSSRFIRINSLGENYTEQALRHRILGIVISSLIPQGAGIGGRVDCFGVGAQKRCSENRAAERAKIRIRVS